VVDDATSPPYRWHVAEEVEAVIERIMADAAG
jgi:hypothetical protein